jgi:hypothetical protein
MKRIFLSHPFTGNETENFRDAAIIESRLRNRYSFLDIINPLKLFNHLTGAIPEDEILTSCMHVILTCDAVVQCDGWENSCGCRAEAAFSRVSKIPLISIHTMFSGKCVLILDKK